MFFFRNGGVQSEVYTPEVPLPHKMQSVCSADDEMEWHHVSGFDVHGWDGFEVHVSCKEDRLYVSRFMRCPDGRTTRQMLRIVGHDEGLGKVAVALQSMRAGMFGCIPKGHVSVLRLFAFAILGGPKNYETMEAQKIDDALSISPSNIGWFPKGEGAKRSKESSTQVGVRESRDTLQDVMDGEMWRDLKYCVYNAGTQRLMAPDYADSHVPFTIVEYGSNKQVSNFGRVRFRPKRSHTDEDYVYTKGTLLPQSGYRCLSLCYDGVSRSGMVHVAVMHTFCGPQHDNGLHISFTVDHENHDRSDNRLSNLSYRSRREQRANQTAYLLAHNLPSLDSLSVDQQAALKQVGKPPSSSATLEDLELSLRAHIEALKARAQLLILDRIVPTLHRFLNGESLSTVKTFTTDAHLQEVAESLFIYSYDELQPVFERSDWVYRPHCAVDWKDRSMVSGLCPRRRVSGAMFVLHKAGERDAQFVGGDSTLDIVELVQLKMFFNQIYSWHWCRAFPNAVGYGFS